MPEAPRFPHKIPVGDRALIEFPMSTVAFPGLNLPIGGGGYFRLFPYPVTAWGIRRLNRLERRPAMVYVHPWEIDPEQPRVDGRPLARWRHTVNLTKTAGRLERLLGEFRFSTVREVLGLGGSREPSDARDRKSTRLNSSHIQKSRMPSSA